MGVIGRFFMGSPPAGVDQGELFRLMEHPRELGVRVRQVERCLPEGFGERLMVNVPGRWAEFAVACLGPLIRVGELDRTSLGAWREYADSIDRLPAGLRDFTWHYTARILTPLLSYERSRDRVTGSMTVIKEVGLGLRESLEDVAPEYRGAWAWRVLPEACGRGLSGREEPVVKRQLIFWEHAASGFNMLMAEVSGLPEAARIGFATEVVPSLIKAGLIDSDLGFPNHGRIEGIDYSAQEYGYPPMRGFVDVVGQLPEGVDYMGYARNLGGFILEGGFRKPVIEEHYHWGRLFLLQGLLRADERLDCLRGPMRRLARAGVFKSRDGWDRVIGVLQFLPEGRRGAGLNVLGDLVVGGLLPAEGSWSGFADKIRGVDEAHRLRFMMGYTGGK